MHLLNPWYLAGLAAILVPILIHILQRDRVKRIIFPATRFLLGASKRITRTQQIRELILLILRAAVMALLALALTRPFWMQGGNVDAAGAGAPGKAAVLLLDVSASMRVGNRMDEARKQALEFLESCRPQIDRVALVVFDREPVIKIPMTGDTGQIKSALGDLKPGWGGGNLAVALPFADRMLQADEFKNTPREIVVVSDLQKSGWEQYKGEWKLSAGTDLAVKPVSLRALENVAIVQTAIPQSTVVAQRPEALSLQVVNFGKTDHPGMKVSFKANGKTLGEKDVNLGPGKTEVMRFENTFDTPGDFAGTLELDVKDDFPDDNVWHFNVRVLPRVQVLLVNGGPSTSAAKDDGRFIKEALSLPGSPFQVREIAPQALVPKDLDGVQAAVFTNVGSVSKESQTALKAFLENGGGVLLFPGDRVAPDDFNADFGALAPCRLKDVVHKDEKSEGWTLGEMDLQHPIFVHFATPQSGDFSSARFAKYYSVTDSQASKVLARFIDGHPALLEKPIGKGYTLLFTSTAGMKWNDFCLQGGVFVPFVHEALKFLAVHSEGQTNTEVGSPLAAAGSKAVLTLPDGSKPSSSQAEVPGLYGVKLGDYDGKLAVNIPRQESETAALDASELSAAVASNPEGQEKTIEGVKVWVAASDSVQERIEGGQRLGWYLLFGILALLFGEHLLANNTSRH
ncbi:MAG: VWA domain-containing protein [Planctomycetes bacterium]|nr:VWA domain-containing protein [Planctomycetota bacterium]